MVTVSLEGGGGDRRRTEFSSQFHIKIKMDRRRRFGTGVA